MLRFITSSTALRSSTHVTRRHLVAAVRVGGGLHLLVGDWRQPQLAENRLDRPAPLSGECVMVSASGHRTQGRRQPSGHAAGCCNHQIFRIEVRAGEHVVVVRHRAVAGEIKSVPGSICIRVRAVRRISEWGRSLVVGDATSRSSIEGDQVFASTARVPDGTAPVMPIQLTAPVFAAP